MATSIASKIPSRTLSRLFLFTRKTPLSQLLCTLAKTSEAQTQKLERIADELLSLSKLEKYDYTILMRHKMGLNKYGPAAAGLQSGSVSAGPVAEVKAATEKVVFDVKLEKFDAAAKIKIIKEVRSFTDLGLKDAKELVEKVPIVVKKGLTKEEAEAISEKLKALGATVLVIAAAEHISQFNEESRSPFINKFKTILHPSEVNRIRELPQNSNTVATHTDSPDVLIWNIESQPNCQANLASPASRPDLILTGHKDNAEFALAMCPNEPIVLSGGR